MNLMVVSQTMVFLVFQSSMVDVMIYFVT